MGLVAILLALLLQPKTAPGAEFAFGKAAGFPNSPIMIQLFSDFQCPACKALHEETVRQLMRDYVGSGKVYLINRNFPLTAHAYARQAALYATAADRIGKYQQVADALFATQAVWSENGKVDAAACSVLTPAEAKKVRALVSDPSVAAEVQQDLSLGQKAGVNQTPTMVITSNLRQYPLAGAVNYDLLRRFLDELLAK